MGLDYPWPDKLAWNSLSGELDSFQSWLLDQRSAEDTSFVFTIFDGFATFVDDLVTWFTDAILWLTWLGAAAVGTLVVLRFGGVRAAVIVLAAFASFALFGLWEASMETLALMLAAVGLSLLIGIPLGVLAGRSDRFLRAISPVLDAMQIVPAFAYLMPVVILFSVGPAAAVVSTMIYAIPPAVRITALGIRGVAVNTVEAAASMGATRGQMLGKVQLPLARRMLLLGVNQTILFALSMVVIAGLIGGGGLGAVVTSGLYSNPALAILGGFAIVIMAMALDRATEAIANRTDPAKRHLDDSARKRLRSTPRRRRDRRRRGRGLETRGCLRRCTRTRRPAAGTRPSRSGCSPRSRRSWTTCRARPPGCSTSPSRSGTSCSRRRCSRCRSSSSGPPWFVTVGGLTLIALVVSGIRPAVTTFADARAIGVLGVWALAMDTLSQVLVATVIAVVDRGRDGRLGGREHGGLEDPAADQRRPADAAAARLHHPVHLSDAGLDRPRNHRRRSLRVPGRRPARRARRRRRRARSGRGGRRVRRDAAADPDQGQVPLAGDAIMLGVNQGIVMVLAVVVIGGLVGSGGLGYEVAQGLVRGQFGQGVIASLAILALGIALDRVTQGTRRRAKEGIG